MRDDFFVLSFFSSPVRRQGGGNYLAEARGRKCSLGGERMKKDIVLIVIIVAVLCVGTINIVNAKEYTRDDYIITFSERCECIETHDQFWGIWSDCQFHCDRRLKINIWVSESFKVPIPDGHPISSLQDAIDFERELVDKTWNPKFEKVTNTYQMTTRNGYDVYVIECIPDSQCLEKRYYIPKGDGTTCIIECRTWNKYYDEMIRDICEPAVQSFKFTGEPTPTPTPTPSPDMQSALEARRMLYQNYGKSLNSTRWSMKSVEIVSMFKDDFIRSFTTPLGILETLLKSIVLGGYSSVEIATKEVISVSGPWACGHIAIIMYETYPTDPGYPTSRYEDSMLHILKLIEEEKYEEAKEEIHNLKSELIEWRKNVNQDLENPIKTDSWGEGNYKRVSNLLTAVIKFLDTEYTTLGGEVIPGPMPTPTPTPNGPGFEAIFAIAGILVVAYLIHRKRQ